MHFWSHWHAENHIVYLPIQISFRWLFFLLTTLLWCHVKVIIDHVCQRESVINNKKVLSIKLPDTKSENVFIKKCIWSANFSKAWNCIVKSNHCLDTFHQIHTNSITENYYQSNYRIQKRKCIHLKCIWCANFSKSMKLHC